VTWDQTTRTWTPAGKLKTGHALATETDSDAYVVAVHKTSGTANRYNLTIAQLHT
jgi:hypothetical protein